MVDGLPEEMRIQGYLRSEEVDTRGGSGDGSANPPDIQAVEQSRDAEDGREANRQRIIKKYPEVFGGTDGDHPDQSFGPVYWEFGYGWDGLIETLASCIAAELKSSPPSNPNFPFTVQQMKEKFGGLRFYTSPTSKSILGMILMAEQHSYKVCEVCGNPATLCRSGLWFQTLCPSCANKNGYVKHDPNDLP
jgi:hypothetical protein